MIESIVISWDIQGYSSSYHLQHLIVLLFWELSKIFFHRFLLSPSPFFSLFVLTRINFYWLQFKILTNTHDKLIFNPICLRIKNLTKSLPTLSSISHLSFSVCSPHILSNYTASFSYSNPTSLETPPRHALSIDFNVSKSFILPPL